MKGCYKTFIVGLSLKIESFKDFVLFWLRVKVECPICLCKFVISTVSESNKPIVPTPAPAKYNPSGQPIPPAPINATLLLTIFNWPS